jgi:PAS domain S-box-containing protein
MKSGEIRQWLCSSEIVNINDKDCLLAMAVDITERKQDELELRINEERFRLIAENSADMIMCVQVSPEIRVDYISPSSENILGYTPDTFCQDPYIGMKCIHPEDKKLFSRVIDIEDDTGKTPVVLRWLHKSGKIVWTEGSGGIIRNDKGEPVTIYIVAHDITERVKAEEALKQSEEKFYRFFQSNPYSIAITTIEDGTFLEINESFTRFCGYTRDDVINRTSKEINAWINQADRAKMMNLLEKYGSVINQEYNFCKKTGEMHTALISAEPIDFENKKCIISVGLDITDYNKAMEEAREAENLRKLDRMRQELLANISHELRTPLSGIKGFATMLMDYGERLSEEEKRGYLDTIDKNTDRLVELVERLLDMSRLEAGMLSINQSPVDLDILCREAVDEARIRTKTHIFTLDLPIKLPKVNIDARRIRQVIDNLIDNAVKYSEKGTEITISVRKHQRALVLTVDDRGAGISQEDLPHIFERMFHSGKRQRREADGAGLGLSICKGLIEAHNGKIWMESEENKGSKCSFTLPIKY